MVPKSYVPKVGSLFQLNELHLYAKHNLHGHAWASFLCREVRSDFVIGELLRSHDPTSGFGETRKIPTSDIMKPLYWKPVYKIHVVSEEEGQKIFSWLKERNGVTVWGSQDLGTSGRTMYTPGDTASGKPHWSMGLIEVVSDPDRIEVVLIEKHPIPNRGKERRKELARLKKEDVEVFNNKEGSYVCESWYETYRVLTPA